MNFDMYWGSLVQRVYRQKEILLGAEDEFWRLSCIYGETMTDGLESYFDRRFGEFDADMAALRKHGFTDVASDFLSAKHAIFGNAQLTESFVRQALSRLLDETLADEETMRQVDTIYGRLVDRLPAVADRRTQLGLERKFYEHA